MRRSSSALPIPLAETCGAEKCPNGGAGLKLEILNFGRANADRCQILAPQARPMEDSAAPGKPGRNAAVRPRAAFVKKTVLPFGTFPVFHYWVQAFTRQA